MNGPIVRLSRRRPPETRCLSSDGAIVRAASKRQREETQTCPARYVRPSPRAAGGGPRLRQGVCDAVNQDLHRWRCVTKRSGHRHSLGAKGAGRSGYWPSRRPRALPQRAAMWTGRARPSQSPRCPAGVRSRERARTGSVSRPRVPTEGALPRAACSAPRPALASCVCRRSLVHGLPPRCQAPVLTNRTTLWGRGKHSVRAGASEGGRWSGQRQVGPRRPERSTPLVSLQGGNGTMVLRV